MTGPTHAETSPDGSRWYIHPVTGERYLSVTTALGSIAKHGLPGWAARLADDPVPAAPETAPVVAGTLIAEGLTGDVDAELAALTEELMPV